VTGSATLTCYGFTRTFGGEQMARLIRSEYLKRI
jgi:hypothetical protein